MAPLGCWVMASVYVERFYLGRFLYDRGFVWVDGCVYRTGLLCEAGSQWGYWYLFLCILCLIGRRFNESLYRCMEGVKWWLEGVVSW